MVKFDLAKALTDAGVNIDTKRTQIEYINIDLIVPDPQNFYELSGLDELAESIALCGLQQPLLVRPMEGDESQVVITSGHRRYNALKMLIEQDGRDDLRDVPCIVAPEGENPHLTQLALIMANSTARKLSSADMAKQAEQIEELLYRLKEDGVEFPGRMRDHVAQACQVSTGKLARLKIIRSKLIPQFLRLWEANHINEAVAYTLAGQPPIRQKAVFEAQTKNYTSPFNCSSSQLETIFREMDEVESICKKMTCEANFTTGCDHKYTRLNHAAALGPYSGLSCRGCCKSCSWLERCGYSCEWAAEEKKRLKDRTSEQKQAQKAEEAERTRPEREIAAEAYGRIGRLRKEKSISTEDFLRASKDYCFAGDAEKLEKLEAGGKPSGNDRMPGGIWASDALRLIRTAELLGCSVDYLLGRDIPEEKPTTPAAGWQTGEPKAPGYYICRFQTTPESDPEYAESWWGGKRWTMPAGQTNVTHWMPSPEVDA